MLHFALVVTVLGTESPVPFGRKEGMVRPLRDFAAASAAAAERNAAPGRQDIVLVLHTPKVAGYSVLNTLKSFNTRWPDRFGELWEPPDRRQCSNQRRVPESDWSGFDWSCACLEGVQFVSAEITRAIGLTWARQVRRRCGRAVHVVGFFRAPERTAVSTFVQLLDHDCLTGAQPLLSAACSRTDTTAGMLGDFLAGKLCAATINACTNKQSRYLLLGDSKAAAESSPRGRGGKGGGGGGGAYAGECVSRARLDSALGSLASLGIVEAFEVSVCLMVHTLGLAAAFRAQCGRGVRLRGAGATITKNVRTAITMPMKLEGGFTVETFTRSVQEGVRAASAKAAGAHRNDVRITNIRFERRLSEAGEAGYPTKLSFDIIVNVSDKAKAAAVAGAFAALAAKPAMANILLRAEIMKAVSEAKDTAAIAAAQEATITIAGAPTVATVSAVATFPKPQHSTLAGFVRPHRVDDEEGGGDDLIKNAAPRSAQLLALVRANATLLRHVRRAHAADEMLYGAAVVRFAEAVGRMSRETGLRFELPASLQRVVQRARDGGHDSAEGGGDGGCGPPSLKPKRNSPDWEFVVPRKSGEG
jgi:hypothetical protein